MELRDFVAQTLIQIAEGIAGARDHLDKAGADAAINTGRVYPNDEPIMPERAVAFDVALTVIEESSTSEKTSAGGKASIISVASIKGSIDAGNEGLNRTETVSRVKFEVMMRQPGSEYERPANRRTLAPNLGIA